MSVIQLSHRQFTRVNEASHKEFPMIAVFKFILDLVYDSVLSLGMLYIVGKTMDVVKYFIQTQHEEKMARLSNEFLHENELLK